MPLLADGLHNSRHALRFWATLIHWLLPTSSILSLLLILGLPLTPFPSLGVHSDVILAQLVLLILATCPADCPVMHCTLSIISNRSHIINGEAPPRGLLPSLRRCNEAWSLVALATGAWLCPVLLLRLLRLGHRSLCSWTGARGPRGLWSDGAGVMESSIPMTMVSIVKLAVLITLRSRCCLDHAEITLLSWPLWFPVTWPWECWSLVCVFFAGSIPLVEFMSRMIPVTIYPVCVGLFWL